jgi:hypothetical protein
MKTRPVGRGSRYGQPGRTARARHAPGLQKQVGFWTKADVALGFAAKGLQRLTRCGHRGLQARKAAMDEAMLERLSAP